ncbi:hypothetical protein [Roseococcus sp. YIM B11640]|uniref:hypothetical protein n=1 Tax=Roseococcus sp. YIM B11640 TaxID=3133973 RepID=UPI003C7C45F4
MSDGEPSAPKPLRMSHPEEGSSKGEGWAVMRGAALIIGSIAVVSFVLYFLANL